MPNVARPSIFDMTGRAKWDAWSTAGKAYTEDAPRAESRYLELARSLGWDENTNVAPESVPVAPEFQSDDIWDSDTESDAPKSRGGGGGGDGGGLGVFVSTMTVPEGSSCNNLLSQYALDGDVEGLTAFLDEHTSTDINRLDENVRTVFYPSYGRCSYRFLRDTHHYTFHVIEDMPPWYDCCSVEAQTSTSR